MSALLRLRNLTVRRGARDVVQDVSFSVEPGDRMALVGPNAAGKSTLLCAIAGLLKPSSGEVQIEGRPIDLMSAREAARRMALVVAVPESSTRLSVRQSTELGRFPHVGPLGAFSTNDEAAVEAAISETELQDLRDRGLHTLSAGERQRALIARALAQNPRLLLLDEPSAHLDVGHSLDLFALLTRIAARGVGIVAVVHDLVAAARWATRMVVMTDGCIVDDGVPASVMARDPLGAAFGVSIREARTPPDEDPLTWRFDRRD